MAQQFLAAAGALLALAASTEAQVLQSWLNPTSSATIDVKATFSTIRTEFRVENLFVFSKMRYIWAVGDYPGTYCALNPNGLTLRCQFGGDGMPDGGTGVDLTGRSDVRVRWQRDYNARTYQLELWNGDCTGYISITRRITNPIPPNVFTGALKIADSMQLAFLRMYSRPDQSGACPVDAPAAAADMLDIPFEDSGGHGTLAENSGHGYSVSASSLASFVPSIVYPPRAVITGWTTPQPVFRAGDPIRFSSAASVVFQGNGKPAKVAWQQLAGPADSTFDSTSDIEVSITPPAPGQYTYRLTVTDGAGVESFADRSIGVVETNSAFLAQPIGDLSAVLGRGALPGKSPWPWYEVTEAADVDLLSGLMQTAPAETFQPGTLYAPTGTGLNVLNRDGQIVSSAYSGVAWVGKGTNFDQSWAGKYVVLHWDPDRNGTYQGRRVLAIKQVISPTLIVSAEYYLPDPGTAFNSAGLAWASVDSSYGPYRVTDQSSYILMFYESGLAVARLYTRTGLTKYQTQFHAFCDNWWRWGLNSGYGYSAIIPRNSGLHTMIACAADPTYTAPADMWDGIARITAFMGGYAPTTSGNQLAINPTSPIIAGRPDVREFSYITRPTALLASLYGRYGGDSSKWCTYLANQVTNMWLATAKTPANASSGDYAFWGEDLYSATAFYVAASTPAGDPNGAFGTSPWRSAGLPALALIYAYEALADPAACNNPKLAGQLFNPADGSGLIAQTANYIWDYGRSADGGLLYNEGYETDILTPGWTIHNAYPGQGTLAVSNGSSSVAGSGTYFTAQFAPCDGATSIKIKGVSYTIASCASDTALTLAKPYTGASERGVSDYANPATIDVTSGSVTVVGKGTGFTTLFAPCDGSTYIGIAATKDRRVYRVMSCVDDTHLTINLPYAGPTEAGINWFSRARKARSDCGPLSRSTQCEPDYYNGRNLAADVGASAAWLYAHTGSATWKARAEFYANKTFGGSAKGSGGQGPPAGTCVYRRPGTIAVVKGGYTVTGNGTDFQSQFACDGSDRITIADAGGATWAKPPGASPPFYTITVASCSSPTSLTLATPYPGADRNAISMFYNSADPQWQCADGGTGNLGEILPPCDGNATPCGAGFLVPKYGKPLGMAAGAGNTPVMIADLLGGDVPVSERAFFVNFKLDTVPNATQVRVTLTSSAGTTAQTLCSRAPCKVSMNPRRNRLKLEYLSSSGGVLKSEITEGPKDVHATRSVKRRVP